MEAIQVLCVDDNADVRDVLCVLINHTPGLHCVGTLESADNLVSEAHQRHADVVLLDVEIPGCDTMKELRELSDSDCCARTIVVSGYDDPETVRRSLEAGAVTCVRKDGDPRRLLQTIRHVAESAAGYSPSGQF